MSLEKGRVKTRDMTEGSPVKHILYFSIPLLLGNVFQQLYNVVDSIVVGNFVGKEALAAVGNTFPVINLLVSLFMGISMGCNIMIAQFYGAKDHKSVRRTLDTLMVSMFFASIFITIVGIVLSGPILKFMNTPEDVFALSNTYMIIIFSGMLASFGYNMIGGVLQGIGDSRTPLYFLIVSALVNTVLDLLFVAVFGWGVAGVAIATVIAQFVALIFGIIYINKKHDFLKIRFKNLEFDKSLLFRAVKLGLPMGVQMVMFSAGLISMQGLINTKGSSFMAGYNAAMKIDSFAFMPFFNFSNAVSVFTGQNIGAGKFDRVPKGYRATLKISAVTCLLLSALVLFSGQFLLKLFNQEPEVIQSGMDYLIRTIPFYMIAAVLFVTNAVIRGAGETIVPMVTTILSLWIFRVPSAYILDHFFSSANIWFSFAIGWTFGLIMAFGYYMSGRWKKKALVRYENKNAENMEILAAVEL